MSFVCVIVSAVKITQRIGELESELTDLETEVARLLARREGIKAELAALRSGVEAGDLAEAPRTEAIVAVLRSAGDSLSPTEIRRRLYEAGRSDQLRSVTATLNHLVSTGKVQRPCRGQYLVL